jgi:hypothetical protein
MEGKRQPTKRTLHRVHVVTRMEEQLWVEAYERLWPRAQRRSLPPPRSRNQDSAVEAATLVLSLGG